MSTDTVSGGYGHGHAVDVVAGAVGGLSAGVFGSIVLQLLGAPEVITRATPALVGLESPAPVAGALLFVLLGTALGVAYAELADAVGLTSTFARGTIAGAAYGLALWLVVAVAFVPLALPAAGYAAAPAFPYVDPAALAGWVGFGVVLGAIHAALARPP